MAFDILSDSSDTLVVAHDSITAVMDSDINFGIAVNDVVMGMVTNGVTKGVTLPAINGMPKWIKTELSLNDKPIMMRLSTNDDMFEGDHVNTLILTPHS